MLVLHKGRKAEILEQKYGLIRIRYLDDLSAIWVNPSSIEKL